MKKYEVLSPVGDLNGFYMAIRSGADAVYLGLPKFNARMKAENISLDNLPNLIRFAHLKDVKVYLTLNTIVTDSEIREIVDMVGKCLSAGVDAFIVQDVGLISMLKSVYPDIILHGSTQLGIHNVRGAKVAKSLGLSRVVLSRECTISDIQAIASAVDIELEVFVQGAMCVCFSGNCYMSSLKHNASGNRGQCKQLCRLPYTLSDGNKSLSGYTISPRDNCMLSYMERLMNLGVCSFKIEGRLRHIGYIGVATNVYREVVDSVINNIPCNLANLESKLRKSFSRGEYVSGYNESNNIIDTINNNHMGVRIGTVVSSTRFKDIYKTTIKSTCPINVSDGLKFVYNNSVQSIGVGNVDKIGNNYVVYGKNHIQTDSIVYKTLDYEFENNIIDYSRKTKLKINCEALVGSRLRLEISALGESIVVMGDVCTQAKNSPMTEESFVRQLSKVDKDCYDIEDITIVCDDVFVVVSKLNELRRQAVTELESRLLGHQVTKLDNVPNIHSREVSLSKLANVNEQFNILSLKSKFDGCVLSPNCFKVDVIEKFYNKYASVFSSPLIINLPIIARSADLSLIDDVVNRFKSKDVIFVANNLYALDYVNTGAKVWAGAGLNIINNYSASKYIELGAKEIVASCEKWCPRLDGTYKIVGNSSLMTFAHCPYKTLYGNACNECKYNGSLTLSSEVGGQYKIVRNKIDNCYFELIEERSPDINGSAIICDMR